ncbi:hypothetical protein [uncultured Pseudokineococcus sp.]|uniref:hypothetical protein n=1 Tax=uncultured Pseudokineococcus sp. TaxID=1642928 RepID=UPI00262585C0|nr:hypothetical protein [uncultured Pseudokineococcus sp.]
MSARPRRGRREPRDAESSGGATARDLRPRPVPAGPVPASAIPPGAVPPGAVPAGSAGLAALPRLLRGRDLRRLLLVRLLSQSGDGAFQLGLAGLLLFSPERAPTPLAVAGLLALVLLPYTLVGPLVGTLLDRWRRRTVLVVAGVARAAAVLGTAAVVLGGSAAQGALLVPAVLLVLSVNRLVLAALGAGLPAVVAGRDLVLASAVVPTVGTLALALGAGAGTVLRVVAGAGPTADGLVLALAATLVGASALAALRLPPSALGGGSGTTDGSGTADGSGAGDPAGAGVGAGTSAGAGRAVAELRDGLRHLAHRPAAARAVAALGASRVAYGVLVVLVVVLARTRLAPRDDPDAALALTGLVLGGVSVGIAAAVATTPSGAARLGPRRWGAGCLALGALAATALALALPGGGATALLAGAAALGLSGQGLKICVDAVVLRSAGERHRGRVVAVHDAVFNGCFVLGALLAALVLPLGPSDAAVAALLLPLAALLAGAALLLARSPEAA